MLNRTALSPVSLAAVKYSVSDSESEFDDWGKKDAPKRRAVISDDEDSFVPEPTADSDLDSPAPPPKAPEPEYDTTHDEINEAAFTSRMLVQIINLASKCCHFSHRKKTAKGKMPVKQATTKSSCE